ncbi:hypothetical protein AURDEDRAFT_118779 [Auricularia subglabra TFB-10046 SS5]|nr:hypothetical protein AURDEDRAFT_118779 [Auricularia subglabra TFB-10046 SS5]
MAVSRAGQLSVDLDCREGVSNTVFDKATIHAVEHRLARVHSIIWNRSIPSRDFINLNLQAHSLESLVTNFPLTVSDDFLGGQPAKLRFLHLPYLRFSEPATAFAISALSTVTNFRCRLSANPERAAPYRRLFELMPQLQCLSIQDITMGVMDCMPPGPAPLSLTRVTLAELAAPPAPGDIAALYLEWATDELKHVDLAFEHPRSVLKSVALPSLLKEATKLSFTLSGGAEVTLEDARGRTCCLRFRTPRGYELATPEEHDYYRSLLSHSPLEKLHTAIIDWTLLATLLDQFPRSLARLTLYICALGSPAVSRNLFASLQHLSSVPEHLNALESVSLEMRLADGAPSGGDARELLNVFGALGPLDHPIIHIRGFSADVVTEMENYVGAYGLPGQPVFDL